MVVFGETALLLPAFPSMPSGAPWWQGSLAIFASCAFLLNGFQSIAQAVEERAGGVSLRTVARVMIVSIAAAALFYCLAVTAASMMQPWSKLATADLAMVEAVRALPMGDTLGRILLLVLLASLLKTWNGIFFVGTRILFGLASRGFLPPALTHLHPRFGSPYRIILLIGAINITGLLLGRGAVGLLVDTSATAGVISFVLCCAAVFVLRRKQTAVPEYVVPGGNLVIGFALLAAVAMAASALITPLLRSGFPVEYLILGTWAVIGTLTLVLRRNLYQRTEASAAPASGAGAAAPLSGV
jgi:amino acid transporter